MHTTHPINASIYISRCCTSKLSLGVSSFSAFGKISLQADPAAIQPGTTLPIASQVDVSGEGGGRIVVRGGDLHIADSSLNSDTYGSLPGEGIDIALSGALSVTAPNSLFRVISADTIGSGKGGDLRIRAGAVHIDNGSVEVSTLNDGDAGDIEISSAGAFTLRGRGSISTRTIDTGKGGNLHINAGSILIENKFSGIDTSTSGDGDAGSVEITTAGALTLRDGASISTSGGGFVGKGGNLRISAESIS